MFKSNHNMIQFLESTIKIAGERHGLRSKEKKHATGVEFWYFLLSGTIPPHEYSDCLFAAAAFFELEVVWLRRNEQLQTARLYAILPDARYKEGKNVSLAHILALIKYSRGCAADIRPSRMASCDALDPRKGRSIS